MWRFFFFLYKTTAQRSDRTEAQTTMGGAGSIHNFEAANHIQLSEEQRKKLQTLYDLHSKAPTSSISELLSRTSDDELDCTEREYKLFISKTIAQQICADAVRDAVASLQTPRADTTSAAESKTQKK